MWYKKKHVIYPIFDFLLNKNLIMNKNSDTLHIL